MASQITQCPHCGATFRITEAQLHAAGGQVRCGQCRNTFDARAHLERPAAPPHRGEPAASAPQGHDPDPSLDLAALMGSPQGGEGGPTSETPASAAAGEAPKRPNRPKRPRKPLDPRLLAWSAGSVGLVVVLAVQLLVGMRGALADNPAHRPMIQGLCDVLGCEIPLRRDLQKLIVSERKVRTHPRAPKALLIEGRLENRALFAQPYPILELSLNGVNGRPVALRRFQPEEYLAGEDLARITDLKRGMAPRSAAALLLEVADPGREAVSFELKFH